MVLSSFFWVRSAGFPFDWLAQLSALSSTAALSDYEALLDRIDLLEERIRGIAAFDAPAVLGKLERKFQARAALAASEMPATVREACAEPMRLRQAALEQLAASTQSLTAAFSDEQQRNRQRLIGWLATVEVREALFLSNPESLQRVQALTDSDTERLDSRARQRLRLGWNYLQRLCAKNDTSSFFGPIAWGRFVEEQHPSIKVDLQSHPWLSSRKTFFEHWVVLRLAAAIAADVKLQPFLPLRLNPSCYVASGVLHFPVGRQRPLDGVHKQLLEALSEAGAARHTRHSLLTQLTARGESPDDTRSALQFLIAKKILLADLQVPPGAADALLQLLTQLQAMPAPPESLTPWILVLGSLEQLRDKFAAGGLDVRMQALEEMRSVLTGAGIDLSREQGRMYVGRFPVYEDCGRNLHVELGGSIRSQLTGLRPLMDLYVWLAGAAAARLHDRYEACWLNLRPTETAQAPEQVDFLRFLSTVQQQSFAAAVIEELRMVLQRGWEQIRSQHAPDVDEIRIDDAQLQRLLALLHEHEPRALQFLGSTTSVHSPDFMLAARDEQAVAQGDYCIVIGEVHPAVHTVSQPVAQPFCPYHDEIRREVEQLLSPRTVVVADSPQTYQRSHIDWPDVPALMQVVLPGGTGRVSAERCLPSGRGQVARKGHVLHYVDSVAGIEQNLLYVIPSDWHRVCFALADSLIGYSLTVRIKLDRVILKRRSWDLAAHQLPASSQPAEDFHSYVAWRRWARRHGMPRFVFVKIGGEPKPIYVDFDNPTSLDLLASLAKGGQPLRFSEMRPAPDELWLHDERGRYCSEFRTSYLLQPASAVAGPVTASSDLRAGTTV